MKLKIKLSQFFQLTTLFFFAILEENKFLIYPSTMLILTFINNNTNSRLIGEDKATAEFISNINIDGKRLKSDGWQGMKSSATRQEVIEPQGTVRTAPMRGDNLLVQRLLSPGVKLSRFQLRGFFSLPSRPRRRNNHR